MSGALDLLASLRLEDGCTWGERAAPFQWADARAVLDQEGPPHRAITRPRGGAKTSDAAGMAIAVGLEQAPAGSKLYACAADRDQGRLLVDSIVGYRSRTPGLASAIEVGAFRVVFPCRDVVLEILAADAPSAWGLRPYFLVLDELAQWAATPGPRQLLEAVMTALPKVQGSRCLVMTSAGDPAHFSRRVFDHAEASGLWTVCETPGPVPWVPSERLADEQRRLPASSYARLHLNVWTAAEDRLVDPDDLAACVTLDGPLAPIDGLQYVIGLDVGLRHDSTVAVCAHLEGDVVTVDRLQAWKPSRGETVDLQTVEEWVAVTAKAYRNAALVFDPWQAIQLSQRLRSRSVTAVEFAFSSQSVGRLATTMTTLLGERRLALPEDETLLDELANVRLRETSPGVMRIDHDPDKHDDHVLALALAAHHLVEGRLHGGTVQTLCQFCGHDNTGLGFHEMCGCLNGGSSEPVVMVGGMRWVGEKYIDKDRPRRDQVVGYQRTRR